MTSSQRLRPVIAMAFVAVLACAGAVVAAGAQLQRVEPQKVCMVNDTVFQRDQIPVQVDGRTYYGCCEMCKGRLGTDAAIRSAKDPVSGQTVDKAKAVIGATPDGKVLYFESEKTFSSYGKSGS
jgi:YHS domain-containing protein